MAGNQSKRSRAGYLIQERLGIAEITRIAEMAYRHAAWNGWETDDYEQFAENVLGQFEALLADHAELAGHPFRSKGYGASVAKKAATIPVTWRPGWRWPARE